MASLCRRPVLAGDSCHASGKTLGRQLTEHFFFRELAVCFFFVIFSRHFLLFFLFFFFSFPISSFLLEFTWKELRRHSASSASTRESTRWSFCFLSASEIETEEEEEERKTNKIEKDRKKKLRKGAVQSRRYLDGFRCVLFR